MSDTINTIIDKKAFQQLDRLYSELDQSHKKFLDFAGDVSTSKLNFNNIKMPAQLERQLSKTKTTTDQLSASLKEQERLEKALIKEIQKKELATESTNKALLKARVETQQINKEQKRQAILSSELTGEYKKQSTILNTLRDRYKDMVLSQKGGTKEAEALKNEIQELDQKLKDVDASVGQHQRSVGNYALATENLHPALGRVNQGLQGMGTSLDSLSNSKNPFKDLTTAVTNFGKATLAFLLSPIGLVITAIGALFMLINRNKDTVIQFDSQLRDVGKTTGLAGKDLEKLGNDVVRLSRRLKTVGTPALLEYATVAGQLGVKGTKNILAFAEGLAKLETASDISGEEGAAQIARLLTLTDGGVENIKDFGDEIVILGNNFAATEKEILGNATAIAQNTAVYKVSRKDVLAYATATKAVGVEAELTGSTIGRTLGEFEKAIRTGNNLESIVAVTGKNAEELKAQFSTDASGVFKDFIKGLNDIDKAGGSVNEQLEAIGITSVRDQRVLGSLATAGFDTLTSAIEKTGKAAGALDKEFEDASKKLEKQIGRIGTAWDNLVLTLENGQGVIGKTFAFLAGFGAGAIENFTKTLQFASAIFAGFISLVKAFPEEIMNMVSALNEFTKIEIDLKNPGKMVDGVKSALRGLKEQTKESGKEVGGAFVEGFVKTIANMEKERILKGGAESSTDSGGLGGDVEELGDFSRVVQREKAVAIAMEKKNKVMEYSIAWFDQVIGNLKEYQKNTMLSTDEVRKLTEEIERLEKVKDNLSGVDLGLELSEEQKLDIDNFLNKEGIEKGLSSLSNLLGEDLAALTVEFGSLYDWDYEQFKKFSEKKIEQAQLEEAAKKDALAGWMEYSVDMLNELANLADAFSDRKIQKYEDEINASNEMYKNILANENISDTHRKEIEEEQKKREEELTQKKRQEQIKQAKIAKATAALSIAINTAAAIIGALAPPPVGLGPIAGIPISIAMGAIGAVQLATVLATPIPAYAEGKDPSDPYEGKMLWGEAGAEAKIDKYGKVEVAKKPTTGTTKKGDTIMPLQDFQNLTYDQIVNATILTSMAHQGEKLSHAEVRQEFDFNLLTARIDDGIKKGFSKIKINNVIDNNNSALLSELKRQRRKNV